MESTESLRFACHQIVEFWEERFGLELEGSLYQCSVSGHGDVGVVDALLPGQVFYEDKSSSSSVRVYVDPGVLFVKLSLDEDGSMDIRISGLRQPVESLAEMLAGVLVQDPPLGQVYVLVQKMAGYSLHSCGNIDTQLERQNYSKNTTQDLDHVLSCLASKDPCGRLVVMDGPPGTGKSYAIRAMARSIKATFVLVAPSLVGSLSGPQVIPALLDHRGEGPIVLVLEDADTALVNRKSGGDMGQLSELLNLGDGLLGEMMDIRIIATTNAGRVDMDAAVKRPGRLCRHVNFGPLGSKQARDVYCRLLGSAHSTAVVFSSNTTLAEVYRAARRDGWKPATPSSVGQYL